MLRLRRPSRGPLQELLPRLLVAACLVACLVPASCTAAFSTSDDSPRAVDPPYNVDDSGTPAPDTSLAKDGGGADAVATPRYSGSPLCNASPASGCYPDEAPSPQTCPFSGAGDASAATPLACRVHWQAAQSQPEAVCDPAGVGHDGDACQKGADCAPGFECVGTTGQCRHYCCMSDACTNGNGRQSFCDIQPMAEVANTKVPVCMPVRQCKLLVDGFCAPGESCEIVRLDGTTSCVAIGAGKAGDSCDKEHCGAGLTCLGNVGSRFCFQLCHTDSTTECAAGLTCRTSQPQFLDPTIGSCDK